MYQRQPVMPFHTQSQSDRPSNKFQNKFNPGFKNSMPTNPQYMPSNNSDNNLNNLRLFNNDIGTTNFFPTQNNKFNNNPNANTFIPQPKSTKTLYTNPLLDPDSVNSLPQMTNNMMNLNLNLNVVKTEVNLNNYIITNNQIEQKFNENHTDIDIQRRDLQTGFKNNKFSSVRTDL